MRVLDLFSEQAMTARECPKCGGKKGHSARTCQKCAPPRRGWPGLKGSAHPAWKGGTMIDRDGYLKRYAPEHQWPRKGGYVLEHVRLVELRIGRRIAKGETVHHIDHDRTNNAHGNLQLLTHGEHSRLHRAHDVKRRKRDSHGRFAGGGSERNRAIGNAIIPQVAEAIGKAVMHCNRTMRE